VRVTAEDGTSHFLNGVSRHVKNLMRLQSYIAHGERKSFTGKYRLYLD
jgi:hypothetical protein